MTTLGRHPDALAVKLTLGDGAHLVATSENGWAGPVTLHYGPKFGDPVISDPGTVDGDEVSWTLTEEQVEARAEHGWVRLEDNGMTMQAGRVLVWSGGLGATTTQTIASLTAGPPGPTAVSADAGNLLKLGSDNLLMLDPDDLPAGGGETTVQIGTVTLPESPSLGLSVSVLADSSTVLPEGVTWDSGGAPTITERMLLVFVWSGEDWVGTYGLPIGAAPSDSDVTDPEWTATFTLGTPGETTVVATASALATDDIGVTGYQVSYDGGETYAPIGVSGFDFTLAGTASTTYADTKLRAVDGAGNVSAWLDVPSYTMATPADTTPPEWTATFTLGTPTSGAVAVTPSALATDDVAVTSYEVTLDDTAGTVVWTDIGMPVGGVLTIAGLTSSTTYADVALRAKDAAGNVSTPPLSVPSFTTASPPAPPDLGWLASYYADDLALANGAEVATWEDRTATYDMTGPAGRRPVYVANDAAFGGGPSVDFNIAGVPYLRTITDASGAAWTSNAQPNTFVVVATFPYVSGEQSFIFSGAQNNARHNLYRHPTTGLLIVRAGSTTATSATAAPADGLAHLVGAIVNGSSTSLILDDALVSLTGDVGTENSTGLTLGANDTGTPSTTFPYRGRIAFVGVIDGIATEGQLDDLWAWAQDRYGL